MEVQFCMNSGNVVSYWQYYVVYDVTEGLGVKYKARHRHTHTRWNISAHIRSHITASTRVIAIRHLFVNIKYEWCTQVILCMVHGQACRRVCTVCVRRLESSRTFIYYVAGEEIEWGWVIWWHIHKGLHYTLFLSPLPIGTFDTGQCLKKWASIQFIFIINGAYGDIMYVKVFLRYLTFLLSADSSKSTKTFCSVFIPAVTMCHHPHYTWGWWLNVCINGNVNV